MTSKEALKELIIEQQKLVSTYADKDAKTSDEVMILYKTISKDLEVLKILKEKKVDLTYFRNLIELNEQNILETYNKNCGIAYKTITKDEYELLKEWLKNE